MMAFRRSCAARFCLALLLLSCLAGPSESSLVPGQYSALLSKCVDLSQLQTCFTAWQATFNITIPTLDTPKRLQAFGANLTPFIAQHQALLTTFARNATLVFEFLDSVRFNFTELPEAVVTALNRTYVIGLNGFSHLSVSEFFSSHLGANFTEGMNITDSSGAYSTGLRRRQLLEAGSSSQQLLESSSSSQQLLEAGSTSQQLASGSSSRQLLAPTSSSSSPSSSNWLPKDDATSWPVRDQAQCGSCWSFAAVATVELQNYVVTKKTITPLSEEVILDCTTPVKGNTNNCQGSLPSVGAYYIYSKGAVTAAAYPYDSSQTEDTPQKKCRDVSISNRVTGLLDAYASCQKMPWADRRQWLATTGPTTFSFQIGATREFMLYSGGLYKGPCNEGGHAVTAVGYGTTSDGTQYLTLRNSWTDEWGVQGYFFFPATSAGGKDPGGSGYCGSAALVGLVYKKSATLPTGWSASKSGITTASGLLCRLDAGQASTSSSTNGSPIPTTGPSSAPAAAPSTQATGAASQGRPSSFTPAAVVLVGGVACLAVLF